MAPQIDSQELSDYVTSTISSVEKSFRTYPDYELTAPIKFELAIVNTKRAEGGLKLLVVDASGKYDKEIISKITFEVGKKKKAGGFLLVGGRP